MNGLGREQDQDFFIEEQVRTDRLHQLFRQSFSAVFGSYLAAGMLCWLCWDRLEPRLMIGWLVLLAGSSLLRLSMFLQYFRSPAASVRRNAGSVIIGSPWCCRPESGVWEPLP